MALTLSATPAQAQPADLPIPAARPGPLPPGIAVGHVGGKAYYTDARGRVLYGMDMRVLLRAGPDPAQFCTGDCARTWEPLLAPAGAQPNIAFPTGFGGRPAPARPAGFIVQPQEAPDWTIIAGPQGPQWVYKGWHMVFARRSDGRSDRYDGADGRVWNTLKYVAPPPVPAAPADVRVQALDGAYVLVDGRGRRLFVGACRQGCADWQPFAAGMASGTTGAWRVSTAGDTPQWTYRDQPVFVAREDSPMDIPATAKGLQP
ncbi:MAG: hypothetical protein KGM17_13790 [Sphingomonadales bacterium]|nr:hypothetical protein [Sphingomonadales bacterium]